MKELKEKVLKTIREITESKEKAMKHPTFALSTEIFQKVNTDMKSYQKTINQLLREKKIVYGITLNEFYFKIK